MINKIALGMTTKQFREENNIPKGKSIRPFLGSTQIENIKKLQNVDIGMVIAIPDYYDRQKALKNYFRMINKDIKTIENI